MVRKVYALLAFWLLVSSFRLGDGFREQFQTAVRAGDAPAVENVLTAWEKAAPQDPDLYVAQFNWLLKKAERVELRPSTATAGEFAIKNKKGKAVGSLETGYDPELVTQAANALTKGLGFAPNRLDMHFGLAKLYEMTGQPALEEQALSNALASHAKNPQPWRWREGGTLPAPEADFVPSTLEQYAAFYWQQEAPAAMEHGHAIAELMEQYYPKSSLGYFNTGVYYSVTKQSAKAYAKLQQADALAPNDGPTLGNLTKLAIELKKKDEASKYLARLRKLPGTQADVDELTKQLQNL